MEKLKKLKYYFLTFIFGVVAGLITLLRHYKVKKDVSSDIRMNKELFQIETEKEYKAEVKHITKEVSRFNKSELVKNFKGRFKS